MLHGDCNAIMLKGVTCIVVIILYCVGLKLSVSVHHEFMCLCLCKLAWAVKGFWLEFVLVCILW